MPEVVIKIKLNDQEVSAKLPKTQEWFDQFKKAGEGAAKGVQKSHEEGAAGVKKSWLTTAFEMSQTFMNIKSMAAEAFGKINEFYTKAATMDVLREGFKGTENDLKDFRTAVAGTVTDADLLKLSNQAQDMGLSLDQQKIAFAMAEDAADKYGGNTEANFQKLVRASEGAAGALKSLGIQKAAFQSALKEEIAAAGMDAKTFKDADPEIQKQIRLQAILQASGMSLMDVRKKVGDNQDAFEAWNVQLEESKVRIGGLVVSALGPLYKGLANSGTAGKTFVDMLVGGGAAVGTFLPLAANSTIAIKGLSEVLKMAGISAKTFATSLGVIGVAITAAALAYSYFKDKSKESEKQESEAVKGLREKEETVKRYGDVLKDTAKPIEARRYALEKLKEVMPEYFKNLDLEKSKQEAINTAISNSISGLENQIRLKIRTEEIEAVLRNIDAVQKQIDFLTKQKEKLAKIDAPTTGIQQQIDSWEKAKKSNEDKLREIEAKIKIEPTKVETETEQGKEKDALKQIAARIKLAELNRDVNIKLLEQQLKLAEHEYKITKDVERQVAAKELMLKIEEDLKMQRAAEKGITDLRTWGEMPKPGTFAEMTGIETPDINKTIELDFKAEEALINSEMKVLNDGFRGVSQNIEQWFGNAWTRTFGQANSLLEIFLQNLANGMMAEVASGAGKWLTAQLFPSTDDGGGFGIFGAILSGIGALIGLADGGIVTRPTLAMVGEAGYPEAVIPLERLNNFYTGGMQTINVVVQGELKGRGRDLHSVIKNVEKEITNYQ